MTPAPNLKSLRHLSWATALAFCGLTAAPVPLWADPSLQQAAPWLSLPSNARMAGMADAFGAVADDVNALDSNPAGLWRLGLTDLSLSNNEWFQGLSTDEGKVGFPLGSGGMALGLGYVDFGSVDAYTLGGGSPVPNGTVNPYGLNGRLGLGFPLSSQLMVGAMGGYVQQTLGGSTQSTFRTGAGLLLKDLVPRFTLGAAWLNGGGSFDGYALPQDFKLSIAYRTPQEAEHSLTVDLDGDIPTAGSVRLALGAEYWYEGFVALRAGDQYSNDLSGNGTNGLCLGAGLRLDDLQLDYAYVNNGALGASDLFSLEVRIGHDAKAPQPAPVERPVEVQAQVTDLSAGTLHQATFYLKPPSARTDITGWALDITDAQGNVVKTYQGQGIPPRQIDWDGTDSQGRLVPGGLYANYSFRTVDARGVQVVSNEPILKALRVPEREEAITEDLKQNGQFDTGSSDLGEGFKAQLDRLAAVLLLHPHDYVMLVGYASLEGPEDYNRILSVDRAINARDYLISKGIPRNQVDAQGYGSTHPIASNDTEEGRALNRRVEVKIIEVYQSGQ